MGTKPRRHTKQTLLASIGTKSGATIFTCEDTMTNANHEPEDLLISPPGCVFIMTRNEIHIAKEACVFQSLEGSKIISATTLCGQYRYVDSMSTQVYDSDGVCSKCLDTKP